MISTDIEDVYELSPLQEGILHHTVGTPAEDLYFIEMRYRLEGELDIEAFERAWSAAVARNAVLRTSFHWEGTEKPLQVVHREVALPFEVHDLRSLEASGQEAFVHDHARASRARGFALDRAPLMRLDLFRLGEGRFELLWSAHHIILEGWSASILLAEALAYYRAFSRGETLELPEGPRYRDYILWIQQQDRNRLDAFWRKRLAGFETPTELGIERKARLAPRDGDGDGDGDGGRYRKLVAVFSSETTAALEALAKRHRVTMSAILQGAWAILLSRYSGRNDVLFGSVVSGRELDLERAERIVGLMVNTLPARVRVSGALPVIEWIRNVSKELVAMREFDYSPLLHVQSFSGVRPGVPLFRTLFAFQNWFGDLSLWGENGELRVTGHHGYEGGTSYPLNVEVHHGASLSAVFFFDQEALEPEAVERLSRHYRLLVEAIAGDPQSRVDAISFVEADERDLILQSWNGAGSDYGRNRSVGSFFSEWARTTPDAVAVRWGDEALSYRELERRAHRLARYLISEGVSEETIVGLCLERSVSMIVAMLAVLEAGGAYLPLDPTYPEERLRYMVGDARAKLVLTDEAHAGLFAGTDASAVSLDRANLLGRFSDEPLPTRATGDNLAYVIYTSGSTGLQKGVAVSHRGITRLVRDSDYVRLTENDVVAQASNASFDAATFEIWGALLNGGRLEGFSRNEILSPSALSRALRERGVTTLFLTTVLYNQIVDAEPRAFESLRTLLFGGEAVDPAIVRRALETAPPERLLHVYGPTENTTFSTWQRVADVTRDASTVPIGRAIRNSTAYVLDTSLEPVPVGMPGELYVGGDGVARGYLARPELTAERFVPSPFADSPGERLYRTGDRVVWNGDGEIEFLGRFDHQVKIRGFRVEPGEIESVLKRHEAVRDAAVVSHRDGSGDKSLSAYVVFRDGASPSPSESELALYCCDRLPEYMVPSSFVVLGALPMTPNGKLDRRALPAPRRAAVVHDAPRTPLEEGIAAIFSEVLDVADVAPDADFFELGGHSLKATRVVSRIRKTFDVELPIRTLFEAKTVAGLARAVEVLRSQALPLGTPPPVRPASREVELPLSFAQQRLWFMDQLGAGSAYNIPMRVVLEGPLDVEALRSSLRAVEKRHESLRTSFTSPSGDPVQSFSDRGSLDLRVVDVTALAPEARAETISRLVIEEGKRRFDLSRVPLLRATLIREHAERHVFLLTMHHIVSDGWSMGVLLREITELYAARVEGRPEALAPLPVQYADFAVWQRKWLSGEVLERHLAHWREQLEDVPALDLPTDRSRPALPSFQGAGHPMRLSERAGERLRELCDNESVTPYMALLAVLHLLLHRYSGQNDIAVGSPIANRNREEIEGLIGFFVNSLVMRARLDPGMSFTELLAQVRETALAAYAHQDLPFETIVEALQPERDTSRNPIFQVSFAFQNAPRRPLELRDLAVRPMPPSIFATRFDLEIHLWEKAGEVTAIWLYATELFDEPTIARMVEHYQRLLENALEAPEARISELSLLAPEEEHRLLVSWNEVSRHERRPEGLVARLEAQARATPEAPAVVDGNRVSSFAELNRRANRVAHFLRRAGVGPESRVGVCLDRSTELVVALIGVLKASAAYVPLDPAYPRARLDFMIADAELALVLKEPGLEERFPALALASRPIAVDVDPAMTSFSSEPETNPEPLGHEDSLAYVMYTSGSTGTPKGAMITRRGLVSYVDWAAATYRGTKGRGAPLHSSISFDLTVTSLFCPLLWGEPVTLVSSEPTALTDALRAGQRFGLLKLTPAHLELLSRELPPSALHDLAEVLIVGGEALKPETAASFRKHAPRTRIVNEYGPTETVVGCSVHEIPVEVALEESVPIGRPVANARLYILDANLAPVPEGVFGELFIGGPGVARGYWNRPELTAERFLPDPFSPDPQARMYRSGDVARFRAGGVIEYRGRCDHQVKIRGYRIEPGEIESVLTEEPVVRESVVVVREETDLDRRLVAYCVVDPDAPAAQAQWQAWRERQVAQWRQLYEDTYGQDFSGRDPTFNITGWNSSYTGEPIPADEMREWVEATVSRILGLSPRRVVEIGCGTGLLLWRVAPRVEEYLGLDFAEASIRHLEAELKRPGASLPQVALAERPADRVDELERLRYDTAILNSVIQYFPSVDYLVHVLEGVVGAVSDGGAVFIGDVRSLPLLSAYQLSVELARAEASDDAAEIARRVRRRVSEEEELVVAPSFFFELPLAIPRIRGVEVLLKRGRAQNELTRFRYDVILHVGERERARAEATAPGDVTRLDWQKGKWTLAGIARLLRDSEPEHLEVVRVPNARVLEAVDAVEALESASGATAKELRDRARVAKGRGLDVDPEDLWLLEETLPYTVTLTWSVADDESTMTARFRHQENGGTPGAFLSSGDTPSRAPLRAHANNPLSGLIHRELVPELKRRLQERLPSHLVPSAILVLDDLPLTRNGKLDRDALPAPERIRPAGAGARHVPARGPVEEVVASAFGEVLAIPRVSVEDSFFDLGGHSLLATQVVSRLREAFHVDVPLRSLFERPTVRALSAELLSDPATGPRIERIASVIVSLAEMSEEESTSRLAARKRVAPEEKRS